MTNERPLMTKEDFEERIAHIDTFKQELNCVHETLVEKAQKGSFYYDLEEENPVAFNGFSNYCFLMNFRGDSSFEKQLEKQKYVSQTRVPRVGCHSSPYVEMYMSIYQGYVSKHKEGIRVSNHERVKDLTRDGDAMIGVAYSSFTSLAMGVVSAKFPEFTGAAMFFGLEIQAINYYLLNDSIKKNSMINPHLQVQKNLDLNIGRLRSHYQTNMFYEVPNYV